MCFVLGVRQTDNLWHHTGYIVQLEGIDPAILRKSEREHIHRDRQVILHIQSVYRRANLPLVPPVDDHFDGVGAARNDPYQSGVVLAHLIYDLPEPLLINHVVVLGHLFACILHHKVVHIDSSWLICRRLNIGRAEILRCIPMWRLLLGRRL